MEQLIKTGRITTSSKGGVFLPIKLLAHKINFECTISKSHQTLLLRDTSTVKSGLENTN